MNMSLTLKIAAVVGYVAMCTALVVTIEEPAVAADQQAASEPISSAAPSPFFAAGV